MPVDPTALDDRQLMILFSKFVQYENYVSVLVGEHEFEEMRAENAYNVLFKTKVAGSMKKPMEARAEASIDPQVVEAQKHWDEQKALRKAYTIQRDAVGRLSALVSRELSRRQARAGVDRRESRWTA